MTRRKRMEQINMDHVKNSVAERIERTLKTKLSPEEAQRAQRISDAKYFANEVLKQCRQQNFTISQFEEIVEMLKSAYRIEMLKAADIVRLEEKKD